MECRNLEITLVSAQNLPDVRNFGLMKVYAKVSVTTGQSTTTQICTPVDTQGETNPRWNFPMQFTISESCVRLPGVIVVVELFCKRSLGDRFVGKVKIQVNSLFEKGLKAEKIMSYGVAGTSDGRLDILYSFGEKILVKKPSGWRSAMKVGFFVVMGGAVILLGLGSDDDEAKPRQVSKNSHYDEGEVFYDAIGD